MFPERWPAGDRVVLFLKIISFMVSLLEILPAANEESKVEIPILKDSSIKRKKKENRSSLLVVMTHRLLLSIQWKV